MIEKEKSTLAKFLTGQIFLTLICLSVLFIIIKPMITNIRQKQRINEEIKALQVEIEKAEAKNSDFQKMLDYLESDQFVEEQARLNMSLKREGEKVAVVQDVRAEEETAQPPRVPQAVDKVGLVNNLEKWISYFFNTKL
ncbi:MAG: septum formation initiator family protein [bacterium]